MGGLILHPAKSPYIGIQLNYCISSVVGTQPNISETIEFTSRLVLTLNAIAVLLWDAPAPACSAFKFGLRNIVNKMILPNEYTARLNLRKVEHSQKLL
jgi:hypothetical protein